MMISIDMTIASVALPTILVDFDTPLALGSWALIANQLTQTIVLPFAGKLGRSTGAASDCSWSRWLFSASGRSERALRLASTC